MFYFDTGHINGNNYLRKGIVVLFSVNYPIKLK